MSDMQRNRGIIKRISTKENAKEVFDKLVSDKIVEPKWCDFDENSVQYIDHEDYVVVDGAIFDVSGAPDERDPSDDDVNEAERLNDTDYRIHAYFYNGGGSLAEMLDKSIPRADAAYIEKGIGTEFFAIKKANGQFLCGAGNSSLPTPRLYLSEENAKNAVERHFRGIASDGYKIVKLVEQ